jgi:hypothetical protein
MCTNAREPVDTVVVRDESVTWFFPVSLNSFWWFPTRLAEEPYHVVENAIPCRSCNADEVVQLQRIDGLMVVDVSLPKSPFSERGPRTTSSCAAPGVSHQTSV